MSLQPDVTAPEVPDDAATDTTDGAGNDEAGTDPGVDGAAAMRQSFDRLKAAYRKDGGLTYKQRMALLKALKKAITARRDAITEAISRDFGNRSRHETLGGELFLTVEGIRHARTHLQDWMEPVEKEVAWQMQPAKARVIYQPLGVVGVIAPWNYPFQLAMMPLVAAVSAGNRVLLKPSEYTPHTNRVTAEILREVFSPDLVDVVEGGPELGAAFAGLPFDHLLFTGSTRVGRLVMQAASRNLTPVTLELGGKSPAIVHPSYSVSRAAERIAFGKTYNAGQTCIAPDYALVQRDQVQAFAEAFEAAVRKSYPRLADNPDYTSIIHDGHYKRLVALVDDARDRGAKVREVNPASEPLSQSGRKMAPTLVLEPTDEMDLMQEEIFGPVLPVVAYDRFEDALDFVNDRPRPLALYYFDNSGRRVNDVLERTVSGGACVNDVLLHITQEELPFGGVGPSGMGAYHGRAGFEALSHAKSVLHQARVNGVGLLAPPYGALAENAFKLFIGR